MRFVRSGRGTQWTREKIDALTTADVRQLRVNAERLSEAEVMALCDAVMVTRPRGGAVNRAPRRKKGTPRLVSRSKAFELRGVVLRNPIWSRGGVRQSDGAVVLTVWASDVRTAGGGCSYLLWAPNVDGSRPWSDKSGGKERLEHCRLALERGEAEGLLVHGQPLEGSLPEDRAASVDGVDPEVVLHLKIEKREQEYWAIWGKRTEPQAAQAAA